MLGDVTCPTLQVEKHAKSAKNHDPPVWCGVWGGEKKKQMVSWIHSSLQNTENVSIQKKFENNTMEWKMKGGGRWDD